MDKAMKFNTGKHKWSLVDFKSFEGMVKVLEFGAEKYEAHNWKKGLPTSELSESLLRHLFAHMSGERIDPESGLPHLDHVACNVMFLNWMTANRPDLDDLPKEK